MIENLFIFVVYSPIEDAYYYRVYYYTDGIARKLSVFTEELLTKEDLINRIQRSNDLSKSNP